MFHLVNAGGTALYFTVVGEPAVKMLRYQQQMSYFDLDKVGDPIQFVNLGDDLIKGGLTEVLERIKADVEAVNPSLVIVDSFRTVARSVKGADGADILLQDFVQQLALFLASRQATTFLVGEYGEDEVRDNPIFTVADGIIWLYQSQDRNSVVRKMQIVKMRGQATMPGLHTFRITDDGTQIFPRIPQRSGSTRRQIPRLRISTGVPELDEMMGGGIPAGDSILVAGPSGSGKSTLATQFIDAGGRSGDRGVLVVFEEYSDEYIARAKSLGFNLDELIARGDLKIIYLRPLDLSVDEALHELQSSVQGLGAKRAVIDSLSGFEVALAPTFREDFRESLYRMVGVLSDIGVTTLMTAEVTDSYSELRFSPHEISFLTDNVILQRYAEMAGQLRKVITVVKMRSSEHSKDLRAYEITAGGIKLGETLSNYRGIITGVPSKIGGE
jgi:circadian clock protein KaiC